MTPFDKPDSAPRAAGSRRRWLLAAAAGCATALAGVPSLADSGYPNKPITIIVPFPPSGGADIDVRLLAPELSRILGQPVVIENVSGGGGTIGIQKGLRAAPDGYTLFYGSPSEPVLMAMINPAVTYKTEDMVAVALSGKTPLAFFTRADHPDGDFPQMIADARKHPGKVSFGTSGIGSFQHLATEVVKERTGAHMLHIPYRGGAGVLTDVVGGQVDFGVVVVPVIAGFAKQGRVKVLAVSSPERSPVLPEVPAFGEVTALKGLDLQTWGMFFVPKGVPDAIVARLNAALIEAAKSPQVVEQRKRTGTLAAAPMNAAQTQAFLLAQRDLYKPVVGRIKFE